MIRSSLFVSSVEMRRMANRFRIRGVLGDEEILT
jgi:hypothetical protein